MNASMYPCHADTDRPAHEQPTSWVRVDDDGDIVMRFSEYPSSDITITMRRDQFLALLHQMQLLREGFALEAEVPA